MVLAKANWENDDMPSIQAKMISGMFKLTYVVFDLSKGNAGT